jgi:hypothetical protein
MKFKTIFKLNSLTPFFPNRLRKPACMRCMDTADVISQVMSFGLNVLYSLDLYIIIPSIRPDQSLAQCHIMQRAPIGSLASLLVDSCAFLNHAHKHLRTNSLQALDRVLNTIIQTPKRQAQHLLHALIVVLVNAICWVIAARCARCGQHILVLRVVLANDLGDLLVAEVAGGDEEALVGCVFLLDGQDMGKGEVADVDPDAVRYMSALDQTLVQFERRTKCQWEGSPPSPCLELYLALADCSC